MQPTQPNYKSNVQNQTVDFGGGVWHATNPGDPWTLLHLSGQSGASTPASTTGNTPSFQDIIGQAGTLRQEQIKANQPAVQTLTAGSATLQQRYQDILDSIKTGSQVAVNQQTGATGALLAARGLNINDPYGQQELTKALLPVQAQESGLYSQTATGQQQNLLSLASQIAQLQSPDYLSALSPLLNLSNQQYGYAGQVGAAQLSAQAQLQAAIANANAQIQAQKVAQQYQTIQPNATLYNTAANTYFNPALYLGGQLNAAGGIPG